MKKLLLTLMCVLATVCSLQAKTYQLVTDASALTEGTNYVILSSVTFDDKVVGVAPFPNSTSSGTLSTVEIPDATALAEKIQTDVELASFTVTPTDYGYNFYFACAEKYMGFRNNSGTFSFIANPGTNAYDMVVEINNGVASLTSYNTIYMSKTRYCNFVKNGANTVLSPTDTNGSNINCAIYEEVEEVKLPTYKLVTDASALTEGHEYVILSSVTFDDKVVGVAPFPNSTSSGTLSTVEIPDATALAAEIETDVELASFTVTPTDYGYNFYFACAEKYMGFRNNSGTFSFIANPGTNAYDMVVEINNGVASLTSYNTIYMSKTRYCNFVKNSANIVLSPTDTNGSNINCAIYEKIANAQEVEDGLAFSSPALKFNVATEDMEPKELTLEAYMDNAPSPELLNSVTYTFDPDNGVATYADGKVTPKLTGKTKLIAKATYNNTEYTAECNITVTGIKASMWTIANTTIQSATIGETVGAREVTVHEGTSSAGTLINPMDYTLKYAAYAPSSTTSAYPTAVYDQPSDIVSFSTVNGVPYIKAEKEGVAVIVISLESDKYEAAADSYYRFEVIKPKTSTITVVGGEAQLYRSGETVDLKEGPNTVTVEKGVTYLMQAAPGYDLVSVTSSEVADPFTLTYNEYSHNYYLEVSGSNFLGDYTITVAPKTLFTCTGGNAVLVDDNNATVLSIRSGQEAWMYFGDKGDKIYYITAAEGYELKSVKNAEGVEIAVNDGNNPDGGTGLYATIAADEASLSYAIVAGPKKEEVLDDDISATQAMFDFTDKKSLKFDFNPDAGDVTIPAGEKIGIEGGSVVLTANGSGVVLRTSENAGGGYLEVAPGSSITVDFTNAKSQLNEIELTYADGSSIFDADGGFFNDTHTLWTAEEQTEPEPEPEPEPTFDAGLWANAELSSEYYSYNGSTDYDPAVLGLSNQKIDMNLAVSGNPNFYIYTNLNLEKGKSYKFACDMYSTQNVDIDMGFSDSADYTDEFGKVELTAQAGETIPVISTFESTDDYQNFEIWFLISENPADTQISLTNISLTEDTAAPAAAPQMLTVADANGEISSITFTPANNQYAYVKTMNVSYVGIPTRIETIVAGDADVTPVFYNLQGVRVENPANGIFIRVQGNKVDKILVK